MDNSDQQAIKSLFNKLSQVERQSPPRDEQAQAYIEKQINGQPAAPYYMAQTIIVQEQALNAAQSRIQALEQQLAQPQPGGGMLSGLFRNGAKPAPHSGVPRIGRSIDAQGQQPTFGGQQQPSSFNRAGGGFLGGAVQTAMGVAGGVLLGNAMAGMFGGNEAQAAEASAEEPVVEDDIGDLGDGGMDDIEF
ncbi:DUF2076 domain-containing protein [Limoniibacter endophyticus]|uniref:DUF2076 domain-containing protein n=1 Tax=Limoniibacter endophyticus TaxID=1565040 RepID=A0A8J3GHA3_9HYPH|nr:DUF2076 family protein [Limoniibacter endophyticus]GHC77629.1 hypothetical protein GCM10010136_28980 [Limoniibacter endophyticus]